MPEFPPLFEPTADVFEAMSTAAWLTLVWERLSVHRYLDHAALVHGAVLYPAVGEPGNPKFGKPEHVTHVGVQLPYLDGFTARTVAIIPIGLFTDDPLEEWRATQ